MQQSMLRTVAVAILAGGLLGGCIDPLSMTIASTVASYSFDGFAYAADGKSIGDIAISQVSDEDCALVRIVKDEPICRDYTLQERRDMAVARVEADRYDSRASRVSDPDLYAPRKAPNPTLVAEAEEAQAKLDEAQGKGLASAETTTPTPAVALDKPAKASAHKSARKSTLAVASAGPTAPKPVAENKAPAAANPMEPPAPKSAPAKIPTVEIGPQDAIATVIPANSAPAFGDPEKQFWMPL